MQAVVANIYEVAKRARVSIATVSRVQRGGPVAPETRRRVLGAIDELRYRPSGLARSLAEGRRGALAIVFPDLSGPYYSGVILGFEASAATDGASVMILATHGRKAADDQVRDLAERVDGLVIMGRTVSDEVIRELAADGVPMVLLARPQVAAVPTVRSENEACALDLTRHLIGHGARRLTFLGDAGSSPDVAERWLGFVRGHKEAGLDVPEDPVRCAMREQEGYDAALDLLRRSLHPGRRSRSAALPDALVCANDEIALGALAAARAEGLAVPADLRVTGWDDIPVARFASSPLTTVRQPLRDLGAYAATALKNRIEGTDRDSHAQIVLAAELVVRASCGCAFDTSPGGVDR